MAEYYSTIAAIATAQGLGGIGIIRISGDKAYDVCSKVFKPADSSDIQTAKGYTAKFGHVYYDGNEADEAVALFFRAPRSYTGEDVVELQCHGGSYVLSLVLRAVIEAGASHAKPGEFTRRAFENNRISLTKAEAVMDIINASNSASLRQAVAASEGRTAAKIKEILSEMTSITAQLAVWADFPEDDVPAVDAENLKEQLYQLETKLTEIINQSELGIVSREGVSTVIAGRPNVGKSSLMNMLAGCERCIVTDIPGTTRDVVEEKINLGGTVLKLSDTAGLRETGDVVEAIGVKEAKKRIENAQLILAVFDGSEKLTAEDKELVDMLKNRMAIAIINKSDKKQEIDEEYIRNNKLQIVYISAKNNEGLKELEGAVKQIIGTAAIDVTSTALANERQLDAARTALENLKTARQDFELGMTLDAVTVGMENAIDALLELTGESVSEKILDEVFSKFCVGK